MDELARLTEWCRSLGSLSGQAEIMARQLMKRADQLAAERGWSRPEALAYLLSLVTQARQGGVPKELPRAPGPDEPSE